MSQSKEPSIGKEEEINNTSADSGETPSEIPKQQHDSSNIKQDNQSVENKKEIDAQEKNEIKKSKKLSRAESIQGMKIQISEPQETTRSNENSFNKSPRKQNSLLLPYSSKNESEQITPPQSDSSSVEGFDMPLNESSTDQNDDENSNGKKEDEPDEIFSKAESIVEHKSIISKWSVASKNYSRAEPQYPQNLVLNTPHFPNSKQERLNSVKDFNQIDDPQQNSLGPRKRVKNDSKMDRLPSPDSMMFEQDNRFVNLGESDKLQPPNNLSRNLRSRKSNFSAKGLGISRNLINNRRNSALHSRFSNKITPIMIDSQISTGGPIRSRQNSFLNASMISQSKKVLQSQIFDPQDVYQQKYNYLMEEIPLDGYCPKKFNDYMSKKTYNTDPLNINSWDFDDFIHEIEQFKLVEDQEFDWESEEGKQRLKDMVDSGRYELFNKDKSKLEEEKMKEEVALSPKKIKRVDSRGSILGFSELTLRDMRKDGKAISKFQSTAGTGGGGDRNTLFTPKRTIKKKDFKSRMKLIKPKSTGEKLKISVKVLKEELLKKNLFSSYRVFTLQTKPFNWTVKRSREDFKWLVENLKREFPKKKIYQVHKNTLESGQIESFFKHVLKDSEITNNSFFKFFLSEEDDKFRKGIYKTQGILETIAKFVNVDEYKIKELKLDEPSKAHSVDEKDEKKLNMFLDQMKEAKTAKTSHYDEILSLIHQISNKYTELSGLIFKLADEINHISNKTKEVESLCAENIKDSVQQSQTYNMMKVALYSWSHEIGQAKSNLQKQITPLIKRLKSNTLQIHDMFQLKRNFGSKYNRAFTKLKMNPGNKTMEQETRRIGTSLINLSVKIFNKFLDDYDAEGQDILHSLKDFSVKQGQLDTHNAKIWKDLDQLLVNSSPEVKELEFNFQK